MKLDTIAEGLADHGLEREEAEAREEMLRWSAHVADPCCRECGFLSYARQELLAALKRARTAGVFDAQSGEVDWLQDYRAARPLEV